MQVYPIVRKSSGQGSSLNPHRDQDRNSIGGEP